MIKEKRRRQRRMKRLMIALLVFLIVAAIAALIVVKVFVVKTVKVEGNKLYNEQLIKETVLNDEYSWNSLYVLLKYTFVDTEEVPFIDAMEITLNSPTKLTIKVYEKGMMGYLHIPSINQMAYFDKDGFVIDSSTSLPFLHPSVLEEKREKWWLEGMTFWLRTPAALHGTVWSGHSLYFWMPSMCLYFFF